MMEGVAARLRCGQRGLIGRNEARQRVSRHPGESQERGRAGPQARAGSTCPRGGLLASEASCTINRDKFKCPNPHLWRLPMSGDMLHHIIRWNVQLSAAAWYTTLGSY